MAKEALVIVLGAKKPYKDCNGKLGYVNEAVLGDSSPTIRVAFLEPVKLKDCVGEMVIGVFDKSEVQRVQRKAILSEEKQKELEAQAQERSKKLAEKKSGRNLIKRK